MGDNQAVHRVMTAAAIAVEPTRNRPRQALPGPLDPVTADWPSPPDTPTRWPSVACQGMGDWPFFGADAEGTYARARRIGLAKAICASCAAVLQCRAFAVRSGQTFGIWGGLSEEELRSARGRSVPAPASKPQMSTEQISTEQMLTGS